MDFDQSFPATTDGLHAALQTIEQFCAARNLSASGISRTRIVVEELFTNTIKYGYCGECDRPVRLKLTLDPVIHLTFEDDAAHFDPTGWQPDSNAVEEDQRPEGQAGIPLILSLSSKVKYLARPGGNRLVITIKS